MSDDFRQRLVQGLPDAFKELHDRACANAKKQVSQLYVGDPPKTGAFYVDGIGFANINLSPANTPFVKWLIAHGYAAKDSKLGGVTLTIKIPLKERTRREAYAKGYHQIVAEYADALKLFRLVPRRYE